MNDPYSLRFCPRCSLYSLRIEEPVLYTDYDPNEPERTTGYSPTLFGACISPPCGWQGSLNPYREIKR